MSVETTVRKQTFAGGQTNLTFSFKTLPGHPEYIKVTATSGGTDTVLTYTTHYTVALESDGVGGVVTLSPTYSTAYTHTVYRDTTNTQGSDYDDYNQFPADTLEEDLDRRTLVAQEISEEINRTVKLPISSTASSLTLPAPVDGKILAWSGSSGVIVNTDLLAGPTGPQGPTGQGAPTGGTAGQMIIKASATDYDFTWANTNSTTGVRGIFTNATVTTGSMVITYSTVGTAGVLNIVIADSNGTLVIPDSIVFAATGATVNVTSFMPLSGNWRYYYIS